MKGSKVACSRKRKVEKKYLFPSNFILRSEVKYADQQSHFPYKFSSCSR